MVEGNFNIHWDDKQDQDMVALQFLLNSLDLVQYVDYVTHNSGHTIDLIITREEFSFSLREMEMFSSFCSGKD